MTDNSLRQKPSTNLKKVIIFCAPSGSGKTTIVKHLLSIDNRLAFSVSACTRSKRENEINGKDYLFPIPDPTLIYFAGAQDKLRLLKENKKQFSCYSFKLAPSVFHNFLICISCL